MWDMWNRLWLLWSIWWSTARKVFFAMVCELRCRFIHVNGVVVGFGGTPKENN